MYIFPEMIDLGLEEDAWTSEDHRIVAQNCCLGNPNITDRDTLIHNCGIINKIPTETIKLITIPQLMKLGCYL